MGQKRNGYIWVMDKDEIKEHRKNSFTQWAYSDQRIDLLIISISGGGIYVCLEILKYTLEKNLNNLCFIKIIGAMFILSIVSNFISQFCAKKSCQHDLFSWDDKLRERDSSKEEALASIWNNINTSFNLASTFIMLGALIMLVVYFSITF